MSNEANEEIEDFLADTKSMVDASSKLVYGAADSRIVKMTMFAFSYHPLPEK